MDGIPIDQWYENNVDIITAWQDGYFEKLEELNNLDHPDLESNHSRLQTKSKKISINNELPF